MTKSFLDPSTLRKDRRRIESIKPRKDKRSILFTKREVDIIALRASGMTLQEAGELVGYPPEHAAASAHHAVEAAKKKLSKNEELQRQMGLRGATLDAVAEVLSDAMKATQPIVVRDSRYEKDEESGKMKKVNIARIENVPDHRARLIAANQTTEIFGALPDKKIVTEVRSFETKLSVIAEIRQNPTESIAMIQALLEQKAGQNE